MEEAEDVRTGRVGWIRGALAVLAIAGLILLMIPRHAGTPEALAAAHKRIPVYYWHMWSGQWEPVMNQVVDAFNQSQDKYQVIPLQVPYPDGTTKFLISVSGGDPPDVMAQWDQSISTWAQNGVLQPLDKYMTPAEMRRFMTQTYPVIHQNGIYKGRLYGMVMGVDVYACYYRPSMFKAAGLDPNHFPTSLEELTADGFKLNKFDHTGNLTRIGFIPQTFTYFAPAFGGGFYDRKTGQVLLDSPQNLRALRYIIDTQKKVGIDKIVRFNAGLGSGENGSWGFIQGDYAVTLDGEWRVKQIAQYAPKLDYEIAPLPPPRGGKQLASYSLTNFLTIPVGAKHPEGAMAFIKFWAGLNDPARAAAFNVAFGWLPNSPAMANSPTYQAYLRKYPQYRTFVELASSENIVTTPPVPYQLFLNDQITTDDQTAEEGLATPEQALAKLTRDMDQYRRQRRELGDDQ